MSYRKGWGNEYDPLPTIDKDGVSISSGPSAQPRASRRESTPHHTSQYRVSHFGKYLLEAQLLNLGA